MSDETPPSTSISFDVDSPSADSPSPVGIRKKRGPDSGTNSPGVSVNIGKKSSAPGVTVDLTHGRPGSALEASFGGKKPGMLEADMGDGSEGFDDDGPFRLQQEQYKNFALYLARQHASNRKFNEQYSKFSTSQGRLAEKDWTDISGQWIEELKSLQAMENPDAKTHEQGYLDTFASEGSAFYKAMDIKQEDNTVTIAGFDQEANHAYAIELNYSNGSVETIIQNPTDKSLLTAIEFQKKIVEKSKNRTIIIEEVSDMDTLMKTIGAIRTNKLDPVLSPMVQEEFRKHLEKELKSEGIEQPTYKQITQRMDKHLTSDLFLGVDPDKMKPIEPAQKAAKPPPAANKPPTPPPSEEEKKKKPKL
ncbi:MAG: hypothetical protein HON32_03845 [Francisellaceae bacterium]|nr:hypothetical protein [Francisellaceae bacterium]